MAAAILSLPMMVELALVELESGCVIWGLLLVAVSRVAIATAFWRRRCMFSGLEMDRICAQRNFESRKTGNSRYEYSLRSNSRYGL